MKTDKGRGRKYSLAYKRKVLLALQDNEFNLRATARMMKVSVDSISRWRKLYGPGVYDDATESAEVISVKAEIAMKDSEALRTAGESMLHDIIAKLHEKIRDESMTTNQLIQTFKEVAPFVLPKFVEDGGGANGTPAQVFENIYVNNYGSISKRD
jgi:hypothetical protein